MTDPTEMIAFVCHEVNRYYCAALGDNTQPPWSEAPEWQKDSARAGVKLHLSGDYGPEASHEAWMTQKVNEGWTFGLIKDPEKKTHPCIVPYGDLPPSQQAKDYIFMGVVHTMGAIFGPSAMPVTASGDLVLPYSTARITHVTERDFGDKTLVTFDDGRTAEVQTQRQSVAGTLRHAVEQANHEWLKEQVNQGDAVLEAPPASAHTTDFLDGKTACSTTDGPCDACQ